VHNSNVYEFDWEKKSVSILSCTGEPEGVTGASSVLIDNKFIVSGGQKYNGLTNLMQVLDLSIIKIFFLVLILRLQ
jgi:N-acetylneuraminic acid mutarotase